MALAKEIPKIVPPRPPIKPMMPASIKKIIKISEFFAPIAFIIPISLVLSLTEVKIVFIIPIPPTKMAIEAKAKTII